MQNCRLRISVFTLKIDHQSDKIDLPQMWQVYFLGDIYEDIDMR